jgi:formate dehydrogenase iron-sulfur subunit
MTKGSLCAMGGLTPMPVQSAIKHFPEDFEPQATESSGAPV